MIRHFWRWWRMASVVLALATTGPVILPHAWEAAQLWWWWNTPIEVIETEEETVESSDPAELTEFHLNGLTADDYRQGIKDALADGDAELANSLMELAAQQKVQVAPDLAKQVAEIQRAGLADDIWDGVKGEADSPAGFAAELTADLFVVGDLRDLAKQAWAFPEQDNVVIALAGTGVVASLATVVTGGAASPAKFGVSALKIGKRLGKLNAKLLSDLRRLATKSIDFGALREVAGRAGRLDWNGATVAATKSSTRRWLSNLQQVEQRWAALPRQEGRKLHWTACTSPNQPRT